MPLRNLWYFAMPARALMPGRMERRFFLDEPILFGRTAAGEAFALRDLCPHRGVPLSAGSLERTPSGGAEIECAYHGWRFATDGRCAAIPSLTPQQSFPVDKIRVRRYPLAERQGLLWIYMGEERTGEEAAPSAPPEMPAIAAAHSPDLVMQFRFRCTADQAVLGLIDPAHGPYVHRSWFWRAKHSIHDKEKRFVPASLGFTMVSHTPSRNSLAYRILGGTPQTEITFTLPGLRYELIRVGAHVVLGFTAVTPLTETESEISQIFFWTMPWLTLFKPVLLPFARRFLKQDRAIFERLGEGLKTSPSFLYVDDADTQIKWYYRMKREWDEALSAKRPFVNPVQETTLRWRT
jgi:phenylpropionate dioxygenase-like ring-hydroxylating dioxygenase large terminal subunit